MLTPTEVEAKISDPSMKNGAVSRVQYRLQEIRHFLLTLDRAQQQQEFVAGDPRQHVGNAQLPAKPLGELDQQRIADRVTVIVVDMLEIIDVEKGERKFPAFAPTPQQRVGAMLDHPPRRQLRQFVVISGAEQLVFECLLLADVGRA